jgi:hypothetical protein
MKTFAAIATATVLLTACGGEPEFVTRCKRNVELRLASPRTAKYGTLKEVAPNPNNMYLQQLDRFGYVGATGMEIWLAYVDSQNAMGGTVRNYIACIEDADGLNLQVEPGIGALSIFVK